MTFDAMRENFSDFSFFFLVCLNAKWTGRAQTNSKEASNNSETVEIQ